MKKISALSKYYKKLTKKINKKLKTPLGKYDEEDYHKLRISIKKLKAFLELTKFCFKNFKGKRYFKPFRKIFKQSGSVREFQLEESTLEKYKQYSIENYLSDLTKRIKNEQKKFNDVINKQLKKQIKMSFKKIYSFIKKIQQEEMNDFMINERKKINDLIQQDPLDPIQVHELRKKLKVDFYNREGLNLQGRDNLKEENNFQELLGKWHDCRIINDHLEKSIFKEEIDPTELKYLLEIDKEIL